MADAEEGTRPAGSAIYYLLLQGEVSAPHPLDATELWHFYDGDPLELSREWPDGRRVVQVLGPDVAAGHSPQVVVDAGVWQSARSLGRYSLVGAPVTPAFTFEGFEFVRTSAAPTRERRTATPLTMTITSASSMRRNEQLGGSATPQSDAAQRFQHVRPWISRK